MSNSRFAVATHILTTLANVDQARVTSENLAHSVNTNPVIIRRIISLLRRADLVTSSQGVGGGVRLAQRPQDITLLDVYQAINQDDPLLCVHLNPPSQVCPIGAHIHPVLEAVFNEAETAMKQVLARVTIAEIGDKIMVVLEQ